MVTRLRVLVREMPPLLHDIVTGTISNQTDMELVAEPAPSRERRRTRSEPDVVVLATPNIEESSSAGECLRRWPRARILVIETSGRRSVMYELRPHATPLGELSPRQLVDVIRSQRGRREKPGTSDTSTGE